MSVTADGVGVVAHAASVATRLLTDRTGLTSIELLVQHSRPPGAKKLAGGDGEWRVGTGDHRIVCNVHDDVLLVLVVAVCHERRASS